VLELREVPAARLDGRRAETVSRVAARRVASRFLEPDVARTRVEEMVQRTSGTSTYLDLVKDGAVVGALWTGGERDELVVYDVALDRPQTGTELVPLLMDRARAQHARMIGIDVQPGDDGHAAVAAHPGFRLRATNMALTLGADLPGAGELRLRQMTAEEFQRFTDSEVEGFAQDLVSAGMERKEALVRSRTLMAELLPAGRESPGMELHVAEVAGEPVGDLWLSTRETMAFVYNIEVRPEQRRRGYGAAIMRAAAHRCRDLEHPVLGLNVFAHNPGARALYDKLGYRVTLDYFALDIPDGG
jgi:ribosomal protein S18 acetylase RimI-like enzyme